MVIIQLRTVFLTLFVSMLWTEFVAGEEQVARIDSYYEEIRIDGGKAVVNTNMRITIYSPAGDRYSYVTLAESQLSELVSFNADVFDAQGRKLFSRKKKDMIKACGFGSDVALYDDLCSYTIDLSNPKHPYTIEYSSQVSHQSLFQLHEASLESKIPINKATVILNYPKDVKISFKQYDLDIEPIVEDKNNRLSFTWKIDSLKPLDKINYIPPQHLDRRRICFSADRFTLYGDLFQGLTWKNVGLWFRKLASDIDSFSDSTVQKPIDTGHAKIIADSLYLDIIKKFRYVSVPVGISGWKPHRLSQIKQKLYGDCKDLSSLLVAKLRFYGIKAYPCLLLTRDVGMVDTQFVNFNFNHVIAFAIIDNDTLWYDPVSSFTPPGFIPSPDQGIPLLVCTDTGGVIVNTPVTPYQKNQFIRKTDVKIDEMGRLTVTTNVTANGNYASGFRGNIAHLDKKEFDQYINEWLLGNDPAFKTTSYTITNPDDLSKPIQVSYSLAASRLAEKIGNIRYFRPFVFTSRDPYSDPDLDTRGIPIWLGSPREIIDSVIIHGPLVTLSDSVKVPYDSTLSYPWAEFSSHSVKQDTVIYNCFIQRYEETQVPVSAFEQFKEGIAERRKLVDCPVSFFLRSK